MAADLPTRMALALRIVADQRCDRGDLAVACVLLLHCYNSKTGRCDPSKRTLASMTAMAARSVARCIRHLRELGYLRVEVGAGTATRYGKTNAYVPVFDGVTPASWDDTHVLPQGVTPTSSDDVQRPLGVTPTSSRSGNRTGKGDPAPLKVTTADSKNLFPLNGGEPSKPAKASKRDRRLYHARHGCTIDSYQPDPERMGAWAAERAPAVKNPVAPATVEEIKDVWRKLGEKPQDFDATYRTYLRKRQQWAEEAKGSSRRSGAGGFSYGHNT